MNSPPSLANSPAPSIASDDSFLSEEGRWENITEDAGRIVADIEAADGQGWVQTLKRALAAKYALFSEGTTAEVMCGTMWSIAFLRCVLEEHYRGSCPEGIPLEIATMVYTQISASPEAQADMDTFRLEMRGLLRSSIDGVLHREENPIVGNWDDKAFGTGNLSPPRDQKVIQVDSSSDSEDSDDEKNEENKENIPPVTKYDKQKLLARRARIRHLQQLSAAKFKLARGRVKQVARRSPVPREEEMKEEEEEDSGEGPQQKRPRGCRGRGRGRKTKRDDLSIMV